MNPIGRWMQRRHVERELAQEMAEHLEEKIERLREEGHS
jgi:hypothetical protein